MVQLYAHAATIPMQFFTNESYKSMSNGAKLLYGLLIERLEREIEQEDYSEYCREYGITARDANKDKNGNIYINYPIEELASLLNVSKSTVTKLCRELEAANLIERRRRGLGQPDNIYVGLAEDAKSG